MSIQSKKRKVRMLLGSILAIAGLVLAVYIYRPALLGVDDDNKMVYVDFENPNYFGEEVRNGLSLSLRRSATLSNEVFVLESSDMIVKGYLTTILFEGLLAEQSKTSNYKPDDQWVVLVFYKEDKIVRKELLYPLGFDIGTAIIYGNNVILELVNIEDSTQTHSVEFTLLELEEVGNDCDLNSVYDLYTLSTDHTVCINISTTSLPESFTFNQTDQYDIEVNYEITSWGSISEEAITEFTFTFNNSQIVLYLEEIDTQMNLDYISLTGEGLFEGEKVLASLMEFELSYAGMIYYENRDVIMQFVITK